MTMDLFNMQGGVFIDDELLAEFLIRLSNVAPISSNGFTYNLVAEVYTTDAYDLLLFSDVTAREVSCMTRP